MMKVIFYMTSLQNCLSSFSAFMYLLYEFSATGHDHIYKNQRWTNTHQKRSQWLEHQFPYTIHVIYIHGTYTLITHTHQNTIQDEKHVSTAFSLHSSKYKSNNQNTIQDEKNM